MYGVNSRIIKKKSMFNFYMSKRKKNERWCIQETKEKKSTKERCNKQFNIDYINE